MAGIPVKSDDLFRAMAERFNDVDRRLRTLERPTGTSLGSLVAQVQEALANITTTVTNAIATLSYTKAQIDSKVASPGDISPGKVTASSDLSVGGTAAITGQVSSQDTYIRNLSGSGTSKVMYVSPAGVYGFLSSSRRYKQDIAPAPLTAAQAAGLQAVTYRYIAAVENFGDDAPTELGLIAEEVHALGLHWLVYYDDEGRPDGVRYELLAVALLPQLSSLEARISALEAA